MACSLRFYGDGINIRVVLSQSFWLRVLPGGARLDWPRWMPERRILGGGRTGGVSLWPFPNSSGWWRLISFLFLTRTSCPKTTHANSCYSAWPGSVVSIRVLPLTDWLAWSPCCSGPSQEFLSEWGLTLMKRGSIREGTRWQRTWWVLFQALLSLRCLKDISLELGRRQAEIWVWNSEQRWRLRSWRLFLGYYCDRCRRDKPGKRKREKCWCFFSHPSPPGGKREVKDEGWELMVRELGSSVHQQCGVSLDTFNSLKSVLCIIKDQKNSMMASVYAAEVEWGERVCELLRGLCGGDERVIAA